VPATAWQASQSAAKEAAVACVWAAVVKGTAWLGWPGPLAWHPRPPKEEEKQLGAAGSGPVPGPVTLWQMPHAAARFPDVRWVIVAVDLTTTSRHEVGCAPAAGWQEEEEQAVAAPGPPPKERGGVP